MRLAGMLLAGALNAAICGCQQAASEDNAAIAGANSAKRSGLDSVTLSDQQMTQMKVVVAQTTSMAPQREATGYIDFNQDRTVPVSPAWTGRIREILAKAGDDVQKGQVLFTIDSPDLVSAESSLISAAGVAALSAKALERAQSMNAVEANPQKDLEQAASDHQTAEANYKAARDALRIFGKTEGEMDRVIATRKVNGELAITSPIQGRVTARNAAPGMLLQPGNAPAPFTVADVSTKWMVANVSEYDFPLLQIKQAVKVSVLAYPQRMFTGAIENIAAAVDPSTHRIAIRSEVRDPHNELRPQMLASFLIHTGPALPSIVVPANSVVREGDGTMTVFVTQDGRRFFRRVVKISQEQDGLAQITEGLATGDKVAGEGALFLSNALALQAR